MTKHHLPHLHSQLLSSLNEQQRAQILRQIQYHLQAPPLEELQLNQAISLLFHIMPGVTRPMSSKGLAQWLWNSSNLYRNKRVLDIGTGCGIQGLVCLLGGAESLLCTDILDAAIQCAKFNLQAAGLETRAQLQVSDLFDSIDNQSGFDLIVFAQPYFSGNPLPDYEFTRGMLDPEGLLPRFFQGARRFLNPEGQLALMGWKFAGQGNDPEFIAPGFDFQIVHKESYLDWSGVQQGEFHIVLLR